MAKFILISYFTKRSIFSLLTLNVYSISIKVFSLQRILSCAVTLGPLCRKGIREKYIFLKCVLVCTTMVITIQNYYYELNLFLIIFNTKSMRIFAVTVQERLTFYAWLCLPHSLCLVASLRY